ncbi:phenylalanine 4-monooxygenase [Trujillonella endophytica]|uniref:Phenylalanine-4-hydroxylase n=1 Tax=Trujillonella endophytica TaxID=673521 RepID=A0A1H8VI21_9ACTN|nr:phenylalanine 4-monooxygenase [Trujillella endophytica]SEP15112.1 phenylalanine-4-hydroxylase [Trujillella endophytica]
MLEEGQLYSPVEEHDDGTVTVHLAPNHPGVADAAYLARRAQIARLALTWRPGEPVPVVDYTDAEHEVWRAVCRELTAKHRRLAHSAYLEAWAAVDLPTDRVPQLAEVSERVGARTGFTFDPAPGLVPLRQFYGALADRTFHSTQYLRHPSQPLYTPEPDLVHEVIGHGVSLAAPPIAELHRLTGEAARRLHDEDALRFLAKVFWFTCEFGVIAEGGELRCYGAGLLSSYGEIEEFRRADVRPLDLLEMGTADYDITHFQPVLYRADSLAHLMDVVGGFFATMDDETPARLRGARAAP